MYMHVLRAKWLLFFISSRKLFIYLVKHEIAACKSRYIHIYESMHVYIMADPVFQQKKNKVEKCFQAN